MIIAIASVGGCIVGVILAVVGCALVSMHNDEVEWKAKQERDRRKEIWDSLNKLNYRVRKLENNR